MVWKIVSGDVNGLRSCWDFLINFCHPKVIPSDTCTYCEEPGRYTVLTFPCSLSALCWCRRWRHRSSPSRKDPASDSGRDKELIWKHLSRCGWDRSRTRSKMSNTNHLTVNTFVFIRGEEPKTSHVDVLKSSWQQRTLTRAGSTGFLYPRRKALS